jgi:hypothetical protein
MRRHVGMTAPTAANAPPRAGRGRAPTRRRPRVAAKPPPWGRTTRLARPMVGSHGRFQNRDPEPLRDSGRKRMHGGATWRCTQALGRPPPRGGPATLGGAPSDRRPLAPAAPRTLCSPCNCPRRRPSCWAAQRPPRPHKNAAQNQFTVGNIKGA